MRRFRARESRGRRCGVRSHQSAGGRRQAALLSNDQPLCAANTAAVERRARDGRATKVVGHQAGSRTRRSESHRSLQLHILSRQPPSCGTRDAEPFLGFATTAPRSSKAVAAPVFLLCLIHVHQGGRTPRSAALSGSTGKAPRASHPTSKPACPQGSTKHCILELGCRPRRLPASAPPAAAGLARDPAAGAGTAGAGPAGE